MKKMTNKERIAMMKLFHVAEGETKKRVDPNAIKEAALMMNQHGYEMTPQEVEECIKVFNIAIDILNNDDERDIFVSS